MLGVFGGLPGPRLAGVTHDVASSSSSGAFCAFGVFGGLPLPRLPGVVVCDAPSASAVFARSTRGVFLGVAVVRFGGGLSSSLTLVSMSLSPFEFFSWKDRERNTREPATPPRCAGGLRTLAQRRTGREADCVTSLLATLDSLLRRRLRTFGDASPSELGGDVTSRLRLGVARTSVLLCAESKVDHVPVLELLTGNSLCVTFRGREGDSS